MRFLFLMIGCLWLASCGSIEEPMGKPLPQLDFSTLTPYQVQGGRVEILSSYQHRTRPPVPDEFITDPGALLDRYAAYRFQTEGAGQPRALFEISRAELTTKEKKVREFPSIMGNDTATQYHLRMSVRFYPMMESGLRLKPYTIDLDRTLSILQSVSIAEREFRQFEFLEKMISDIDRVVSDIVTNKL